MLVLNQRENLAIPDLDHVGPDIDRTGRENSLAGWHMETAKMQVAFDILAIEFALGETGETVRAAIVGRVESPFDVVDSDGGRIPAIDTSQLALARP